MNTMALSNTQKHTENPKRNV